MANFEVLTLNTKLEEFADYTFPWLEFTKWGLLPLVPIICITLYTFL